MTWKVIKEQITATLVLQNPSLLYLEFGCFYHTFVYLALHLYTLSQRFFTKAKAHRVTVYTCIEKASKFKEKQSVILSWCEPLPVYQIISYIPYSYWGFVWSVKDFYIVQFYIILFKTHEWSWNYSHSNTPCNFDIFTTNRYDSVS